MDDFCNNHQLGAVGLREGYACIVAERIDDGEARAIQEPDNLLLPVQPLSPFVVGHRVAVVNGELLDDLRRVSMENANNLGGDLAAVFDVSRLESIHDRHRVCDGDHQACTAAHDAAHLRQDARILLLVLEESEAVQKKSGAESRTQRQIAHVAADEVDRDATITSMARRDTKE